MLAIVKKAVQIGFVQKPEACKATWAGDALTE